VLRYAGPVKDKRLLDRIRILWACVLALAVCLPALGAVYQWKDASGTLHFSDTPPPGRPFHLLGEDPSGKPASAPLPTTRKHRVQSDVSPHAKGVFWKIEKPGASPSFLLGTIHVEDPRVLALPPKVKTAFETADTLVLELVLDEATVFKAAASMMYMDQTDLENVLGKSLFERAAAAMAAYGVPQIALRRMKPWAVLSTLMIPKPKTGNFLDIVLYRQAVKSGKKVVGLETVEEQVGALESLSMEDQIEILRQTLDQLEALPRMYGTMIETYLAGDLTGLVALSERFVRSQDRNLVKRFMEREPPDGTTAHPPPGKGKRVRGRGRVAPAGRKGVDEPARKSGVHRHTGFVKTNGLEGLLRRKKAFVSAVQAFSEKERQRVER